MSSIQPQTNDFQMQETQ